MTASITPESNKLSKLYGVHNNRELIVKTGDIKTGIRYEIDEDKLDLFSYYTKPIPDWKPQAKVKPYSELTKIFLDIETAGLDPNKHRIFLIGLMNERGDTLTIKAENEAVCLSRLFRALVDKNPDILATFNGFEFDLPFIIRRCEILGVPHPFYVRPQKTVFRTAQLFGKPVEYNAIYLKNSSCAIIDLYHQVLAWDFVARKLTSHSLKQSALQMGLRKEARLELLYEEMLECWENREEDGSLNKLEEYLEYDLEDTKLLGDRLIPSIYYQKLFLPEWKLQSLSTSGNGTKWHNILDNEYRQLIFKLANYYQKANELLPENRINLADVRSKIKSDAPVKFQGGLTFAVAGFFRNVFKIDVNSLYPSIILLYGLCSNKDSFGVMLMILKYMRLERLRLKDLAEDDPEADQMQGAMKVMINSAYGMLGTTGIGFNDYEAAALVTAYGRAILKLMMKKVNEYGGYVIEADTDGLCITCPPGKEREIWEKVNNAMPEGISIAFEWTAKSFFVPPKTKNSTEGLKKNYIIVYSEDKIKANGKYRKRDKHILERTFQPELIKRLTFKGKASAQYFYDDIVEQLMLHEYPLENLIVKRKIRVNEKTLVELGLGQPGENTWYYFKLDRIGAKGKKYYVQTQTGEYSEDFYIDLITEQYEQIMRFV